MSAAVERLIRYAYAGDGVTVNPPRMTRIIRKSLRTLGYARTVQLIDAMRVGALTRRNTGIKTADGIVDTTGETAAQRVDFERMVL